jgi:Tol biopolymer transport system component
LTTSVAADSDPVWSPDGGRLAFRSLQSGRPELFVTPSAIATGGDGPRRALRRDTDGELATDWRDGELLIQKRGRAGFDLVRVDERTGGSIPVADSPFSETDGRWSPDGRMIAYVSNEPGRPDIYVLDEGNARRRVSLGGGTNPRWTRDGRALLFLRGATIMRAEMNGSGFGSPRPIVEAPGIRDFDVSRRDDRIVALLPESTGASGHVSVVSNWRSLLPLRPAGSP